jgi:glyoxylase I family protein
MHIHHLALRVRDPERSASFYAGVLGLKELRRFHQAGDVRSIWLEAGAAVLMLERALKGEGPAEGSAHLLAFAVDELSGWEARLERAGLAVSDRTAHTLYVSDPDGHRVGLTSFAGRESAGD